MRVFELIDRFKTRDELLDDEARKFVAAAHPPEAVAQAAGYAIKAIIDDDEVRENIVAGNFGGLAANAVLPLDKWLALDEKTRRAIVAYINDYVNLAVFQKAA